MEQSLFFARSLRGRLVLLAVGLMALIPLASMALQPRSSSLSASFNPDEKLVPVCFDKDDYEVPASRLQEALDNGGVLGTCDQREYRAADAQFVPEIAGFDDEERDRNSDDASSSSVARSLRSAGAFPKFFRAVSDSMSSVSSDLFSSVSSVSTSSSSSSVTAVESSSSAQVMGTQSMEENDGGGTHIESHMNVNVRTSTDGDGQSQTVETRQVWENGVLKVNESNVSGGVSSMYYDDQMGEDGEERDDEEDMPEWMEDMFND